MSKERPILFSAPMVRALLAGTKTQTRRVVKQEPPDEVDGCCWVDLDGVHQFAWTIGEDQDIHPSATQFSCPHGQPGDRLWVRETHYLHGIWGVHKDEHGKRRWSFHPNRDMGVQLSEPNGFIRGRSTTVPGWHRRPSIHMPRWASRITLEVTEVRVERLQDISEADAQVEGVYTDPACPAYDAYAQLWDEINGAGSWEANPWVWAITFKRVEK
ncbi:hypothetical protein [Hydrogenophaga atypica]|uniref:Phage-related protein n=1 Tax=Hydrogenophaga atypica TaxID=249409 RepID=A0ABW2QI01_9BURK